MDAKRLESDPDIERALQLVRSGKKNSEELKRARERGDELRKQMRAKYGARDVAVQLIREVRDAE
jgi:hypothetical protein